MTATTPSKTSTDVAKVAKFTDDQLAEIKTMSDAFNAYAGVDSGLSDEERFARGVAQAVRAWLAPAGREAGPHSVFLLQATLPESMEGKPRRTYYALDDGETDVTSGMWFVGPAVIQGVRVDAAGQFDDIFPAVVSSGLGDIPSVTFRRTEAGPVLRYYPSGLGCPETRLGQHGIGERVRQHVQRTEHDDDEQQGDEPLRSGDFLHG